MRAGIRARRNLGEALGGDPGGILENGIEYAIHTEANMRKNLIDNGSEHDMHTERAI